MSSKNEPDSGAVFGFAMICAAVYYLAIFVFVIALILAAIMTVICLIACFRPITICGHTYTAGEAKVIFAGGIGGGMLIPIIIAIIGLMIEVRDISDDTLRLCWIGGYSAGLLLVGFMVEHYGTEAQNHTAANAARDVTPPVQPIAPPAREPFTYASWDDEEKAPEEPKRGCGGCDRYRW